VADSERVTSAYLFAQDLHDEGVDLVLDRLRGSGLNGATMAAAYHHARDVFPHNPRHKVIYLEGGAIFFQPDHGRYSGTRLKPHVAAIAREADPLPALVDAAARRDMCVGAWVVSLHNTRLAFQHPDCAPLNAFGDPLLNYLCPAHPEVRAYARALASDVARHHVHSIKLEALSYMPFDHGYHHERSFIRLSPNIRYLLGLCFCASCMATARSAGVDAERVRDRVREIVAAIFQSAQHETRETYIEEQWLRSECDGELGRFLDLRQTVVTSLVEEVTAAVHAESPETQVLFLDPSGATLGYSTGRPATEHTATSIAWRDGVDLAAVALASDGLGALAYFAEPDRFEREVNAYLQVLPDESQFQQVAPEERPHRQANPKEAHREAGLEDRAQQVTGPGKWATHPAPSVVSACRPAAPTRRHLEVLVRPMLPDADSPHVLAAKVATLRRMGINMVSFYHYGFMRLESLDWIRFALASNAT
jgi:hypothetical protein